MNLTQLTTFLAITRLGSFSAAAGELGYSPSSITLQIQNLESELGVELFDRSGRVPVLSDAGRELVPHAEGIVDRVELARGTMREVSAGEGGRVALGAMEPTASLRLPQVLARFADNSPNVAVTLDVGGSDRLCNAVDGGQLDFAVCAAPRLGLEVSFQPLFSEPMGLLAPVGHHLLTTGLDEGFGDSVFVTSDETCSYRPTINRTLRNAGMRVGRMLEISSMRTVVAAVSSGLGVAIVPTLMADPLPAGTELRRLPDDGAATVGIVSRDKGARNPAAAELRSLIEGTIGA